jgi:uncharacterized protein (DUF4415 family)
MMKKHYEFKGGKRGAVIPTSKGRTRITIRIDDDTLNWFRKSVHEAGGGSYQTSINDALREFITNQEAKLEDTFRRVLREELPRYTVKKRSSR